MVVYLGFLFRPLPLTVYHYGIPFKVAVYKHIAVTERRQLHGLFPFLIWGERSGTRICVDRHRYPFSLATRFYYYFFVVSHPLHRTIKLTGSEKFPHTSRIDQFRQENPGERSFPNNPAPVAPSRNASSIIASTP